MILYKFIIVWIFAIIFGFVGRYAGDGFFNFGFIILGLASIPYLFFKPKRKKSK